MARTSDLDEVSIKELYTIYMDFCVSTVSYSEFQTGLQSYEYAVMCREKQDGSLRGMMTIGLDRKELNGFKYTLLSLGFTMFRDEYTGGPLLYYAIGYHIVKELLLHPLTPLYIIGKSVTYKSYLVNCRNFVNCYPRFDRDTPAFAKQIIDDFAMSTKAPSDIYDSEKFVLKREFDNVKPEIVQVNDKDLRNPHIKFFVERVPEWAKGHRLITMSRICWHDFAQMMWKRVAKKNK